MELIGRPLRTILEGFAIGFLIYVILTETGLGHALAAHFSRVTSFLPT